MKSQDESRPDRLPTVSGPSMGPANLSVPPEVEGYEILGVLGEGGMGIVYLARQKHPVQRQVALKIIKPGMDSRRVVTRFEAEQQALALLDHPNIAQVYNAGTTKSGHPFFSMEYVSGLPITDHCDRYGLSIEERLDLFVQVCEGIQHAHQKGIIHRDIKPSNILVFTQSSRALPKIIDFGVSKALSASLTSETYFTEQGQLVGTPEYMSPEQAQMTPADIDTRSDIYSLGIVLYELLVGTIPFDAKALREGGIEKIRHMICEEEPKTPSMRLSTLSGEASACVARRRCTNVRTLTRQLHEDLDWITLKAMEKDRMRRYSAAGELAADIRRHINHEPVVAGPPSASYQFKKFVRRHRHFTAGAAVVALSLVLGFAVSITLYFRAENLRAEAQESSQRAQQAREEEANARAVAQAAVRYLTDDVLGLVAPERAKGREISVKALLDKASINLESKLEGQPVVEADIRQTLGETYRKLGEYASAEPHLERACEIRRQFLGKDNPSTLTSMSQLGRLYFLQARYEKAEPLLSYVYNERCRTLPSEDPNLLESKVRLAMLYCYHTPWIHHDQMLKLLTEASDTGRNVLGEDNPITLEANYGLVMWYALNRSFEGLGLSNKGFEIANRAWGSQHPLTLQFMSCLTIFDIWQARYKEAVERATKACNISRDVLGPDHPITLQCMWALGYAHSCQFELSEAEKQLMETVRRSRSLLGNDHFWTLCYLRHLALLRVKQGDLDEAKRLLTEVLESGRRTLGDEHGWVLDAMSWMMKLYAMQNQGEKLKSWCSDEIERLQGEPDENRNVVAQIHCMLGLIRASYPSPEIRNESEAMKNATTACELTNWNDWRCIDALAAARAEAGDFNGLDGAIRFQIKANDLAMSGPPISALEAYLLLQRRRLYESGRPYREALLSLEGSYLYAQGYYEEADRVWKKTLEQCDRVFGEQHPETQGCRMALVELYETWGEPEKAEEYRKKLPKKEAVRLGDSSAEF